MRASEVASDRRSGGCSRFEGELGARPLAARAALALLGAALLAGCPSPQADYEEARRQDTPAAYRAFIAKHPKSDLVARARQDVDRLDWAAAAQKGDREAYVRYLEAHADGAHRAEADRAIETLDWQAAKAARTVAAAEQFLAAHPQSDLAPQARSLVEGIQWAEATASVDRTVVYGTFMGGYTRFIDVLHVAHRLRSPLGKAQATWFVVARRGKLDANRSYTQIARNGSDVQAGGVINLTRSTGARSATRLAGLVWNKEENLIGSQFYSHDTHFGTSDPARVEGLRAVPAMAKDKPVALFRISKDLTLRFEP